MGYDEFLLKNPGFHQKFLLSMAKEQLPQERPDVTVNISWLSNDRLAYKQGLVQVEQSPQDVAFRAMPTAPSEAVRVEDQAWKEDKSTEYQKAHREFDK